MNSKSVFGTAAALAAALLAVRPAAAQPAPAAPAGDADDDVEVQAAPAPSTSSQPAAPTSPVSPVAPSAPTSVAPTPAPVVQAPAPPDDAPTPRGPHLDAKSSVSEMIGIHASQDPVGRTEAPKSLVAEGSNYVRPIRRGFQWWGFVQAQYERNGQSEDQLAPGGEPLNLDQFVLRRARLRVDRGWENASATVELDASTINGLRVTPRRAEASVFWRGTDDDSVAPIIVVTGGITDLPFGAEIGESQRDRVFMERSIGSLALFPSEADIGFKAWGAYKFVNYAVAVVNGQPLNEQLFPRDPNAAKDIVGRVGVRAPVATPVTVDGGLSFYTGKGFSPGRDATKDSVTWVDDNNNGFAEPHEFQGVTGSAALPSQNFARWAFGLDLGVSLKTRLGLSRVTGEAVVASNMDRGLLVSDPVAAGADIRQLVLSISGIQQITDWGFLGFRAAYYDPNSDVLEQRAGTFHIRDQSYWVFSPTLGLTLPHGRLVGQYDFVTDHLGRDSRGVPTDAKNDQFTLRLQVDL